MSLLGILHTLFRQGKRPLSQSKMEELRKRLEKNQEQLQILEDSDLDKHYLEIGGYKDKQS